MRPTYRVGFTAGLGLGALAVLFAGAAGCRGFPPAPTPAPVEQLAVPPSWGGAFRQIAFAPQIGVARDTFECAEGFQLLGQQPAEPGAPKAVARLVGTRSVTVYRPVFAKFTFAAARELHVAVGGDDRAAGTAEAPFKTIAAAIARTRAGDHIIVGPGTYYEALRISNLKGTPEQPIVLRAADGGRPRIELPPGEGAKKSTDSGFGAYHTTVIRLQDVEYVQIHGFEIVGASGRDDEWLAEYNSATGIQGTVGPGVIISENHIRNNTHCGIKLEARAPYLVIGNLVYNNGASRHHDHGTYHHGDHCVYLGNVFFANSGFAFHFYGSRGRYNILRGNIVAENKIGVMMDGRQNLVVNNVFAYNDGAGIWMWGTQSYDNLYVNNVLIENGWDIERLGYGQLPLPTATFVANLFRPREPGSLATENTPESFWNTRHTQVADPRFIDAAGYDFRPRKDSPCIDAGADVGAPFAGTGPDIGAFEREP